MFTQMSAFPVHSPVLLSHNIEMNGVHRVCVTAMGTQDSDLHCITDITSLCIGSW
jgi:hypothetical protein